MIKTLLIASLSLGLFLALPLFRSLSADELRVDARTGRNVRRDTTSTNSLYKVLRGMYRPENKQGTTSSSRETSYKRVPPPKWSYYGTVTEEEGLSEKKSPAVDGRYYKPTEPDQE